MRFKKLDHYFTGVAIPVSALKTSDSCGIGEFLDLEVLGKWCVRTGIEVIQLLPVNDTGFETSPYSALSAFALHPAYMRLQDLPELEKTTSMVKEIISLQGEFNNASRVAFYEVVKRKLEILLKIFSAIKEEASGDPEIQGWIKANSWIKSYAVYNTLKARNSYKHWKEWSSMRRPEPEDIDRFWSANEKDCLFYAWVQLRLEQQFMKVSRKLESMGLCLKGDIPILMNEDSADIWYNTRYFRPDFHAGAPPDMFSGEGQNWGFPVYNWEALEKDNFVWWRERLKEADKFYHAYRIDHVLGFFRIWKIPAEDRSGILGFFDPYAWITRQQLIDNGFDLGRIRWLSLPHVSAAELPFSPALNERVKELYLVRIGEQDLFNLVPSLRGEEDIYALNEPAAVKEFLIRWFRNKTLLEVHPGKFQRNWKHEDTKAYQFLHYEERMTMANILKRQDEESEVIWEEHGTKLLSMMKETTGMLMCAEDLGVVPSCVPAVLKELDILSLKVERWTRNYDKAGSPFVDIKKYPFLSVCTPSVHDTSTIRGWWTEEIQDQDRFDYFHTLKLKGSIPDEYSRKLGEAIVKKNLDTTSVLTVFQLQDLLYLNPQLDEHLFDEDRINVPGTVSDKNWTYRIPVFLEDMSDSPHFEEFNTKLKGLINKRSTRKVKPRI